MLIAAVVALTLIYWRSPSPAAASPRHWSLRTVEAGGHRAVLAGLDAGQGRNWSGKAYQLVLCCKDRRQVDVYVAWGP